MLSEATLVEPQDTDLQTSAEVADTLGFKLPLTPQAQEIFGYVGKVFNHAKEKYKDFKHAFDEKVSQAVNSPKIRIFNLDEEDLVLKVVEGIDSDERRDNVRAELLALNERHKLTDEKKAQYSKDIYNKVVWPMFYAKIAGIAGLAGYVLYESGSLDKAVDFVKEHLPPITPSNVGLLAASWVAYEELGPQLIQAAIFGTGLYQKLMLESQARNMRNELIERGVIPQGDFRAMYALR